jgi:hypothetical protein
MQEISKETQKPSLTDIINEWMRGDPLLCQHFRWEWPKPKGKYDLDCFYIGICNKLDMTSYAVGFVGTSPSKLYIDQTLTWEWTVKEDVVGRRQPNIRYFPEDPQFFEKLKAGLIAGHNSLSSITKCTM